jgi:hypothetical protein
MLVSGHKSVDSLMLYIKVSLEEKAQELLKKMDAVDEAKKKGVDGKACWKGYRYAGTKNGKDRCVPVSEDVEQIMAGLIEQIIKK